jgi:hypothetical protein
MAPGLLIRPPGEDEVEETACESKSPRVIVDLVMSYQGQSDPGVVIEVKVAACPQGRYDGRLEAEGTRLAKDGTVRSVIAGESVEEEGEGLGGPVSVGESRKGAGSRPGISEWPEIFVSPPDEPTTGPEQPTPLAVKTRPSDGKKRANGTINSALLILGSCHDWPVRRPKCTRKVTLS